MTPFPFSFVLETTVTSPKADQLFKVAGLPSLVVYQISSAPWVTSSSSSHSYTMFDSTGDSSVATTWSGARITSSIGLSVQISV